MLGRCQCYQTGNICIKWFNRSEKQREHTPVLLCHFLSVHPRLQYNHAVVSLIQGLHFFFCFCHTHIIMTIDYDCFKLITSETTFGNCVIWWLLGINTITFFKSLNIEFQLQPYLQKYNCFVVAFCCDRSSTSCLPSILNYLCLLWWEQMHSL